MNSAAQGQEVHIPFRATKLTMVLWDSFQEWWDNVTVGMIACVSPGYSHADHTLNTIRYAERLKDFPPIEKYEEKVKQAAGYCPTPVRVGKKEPSKAAPKPPQ